MNIEECISKLKRQITVGKCEKNIGIPVYISDLETLLTAYEKEKEKNKELIKERATEIVYVDRNFIRKDKIKPIQIIDLDGKIHNVYKIEEE